MLTAADCVANHKTVLEKFEEEKRGANVIQTIRYVESVLEADSKDLDGVQSAHFTAIIDKFKGLKLEFHDQNEARKHAVWFDFDIFKAELEKAGFKVLSKPFNDSGRNVPKLVISVSWN